MSILGADSHRNSSRMQEQLPWFSRSFAAGHVAVQHDAARTASNFGLLRLTDGQRLDRPRACNGTGGRHGG